jgi:hypothetical protein
VTVANTHAPATDTADACSFHLLTSRLPDAPRC